MDDLNYWTKKVLTVTESDSVRTAARLMEDNNVSALVIVEGTKPRGIFTQRDLTRVVAEGIDTDSTSVSEVMTKDPVTLRLSSDPKTAEKIMLGEGFRHMPVVDNGDNLVGIVSLRDILRTRKT